jgi:hypothetical protein
MPARNFYLTLQAYIGEFHNFTSSLQKFPSSPFYRSIRSAAFDNVRNSVISDQSLHKWGRGTDHQILKKPWDFRFSRQKIWRCYGLLRRVVWYKFTDVSEVLAASIMRVVMCRNQEDILPTKLLHSPSCIHLVLVIEAQRLFKASAF